MNLKERFPKPIRHNKLNQQIQSVMQKENWQGAIELCRDHIELIQADWKLSWNLGWAYFKLDRLREARKHLLRATNLAPKETTCYWAVGTVYSRLKDYEKAEASLSKSLSIKDSRIARIVLARALLEQGKIDDAEQIHLEGLRLQPNDGERYKSYGCFLS